MNEPTPRSPEGPNDPFEALYDPTPPVQPDTRFGNLLRERVAEAMAAEVEAWFRIEGLPGGLSIDELREIVQKLTLERRYGPPVEPAADERKERPVTVTGSHVVVGTHVQTVTPYLCVHEAEAALGFYEQVFGAEVVLRVEGPDGRLGHSEFRIGGARFFLSDEYPDFGAISPRTLGGTTVTVHLEVADVDALFSRAVEAGALVQRPPADQPHGARTATLLDPFGHRWMLSERREHVTVHEYAARQREWTVRGGADLTPPETPAF